MHLNESVEKQQDDEVWSFLPYEEERETPRRELQILRVAKALVIPLVDMLTFLAATIAGYLISSSLVNSGSLEGIIGVAMGNLTVKHFWTAFAAIPLWLLVFHLYGVYKREIRLISVSTFDELSQTIGALAVGAWVMFTFLVIANKGLPSGRAIWVYVATVWLLLMLFIPLNRGFIRIGMSFYNPFRTSTLVVGAGEVGKSLVGRLSRHKEYGLRVVGFLDTMPPAGVSNEKVKILGRLSDLRKIVDQLGISRVIIAFSKTPHPRILNMIHQCQEMKVDVSIVPRFFEALSSRVEIEDVEGLTMVSMPRYARHGFIMRSAKRLLDLVCAVMIIILLSPLLILLAILIKLDSPGPVMFKQERMGKDRRHFKMYKFRSMHMDADKQKEELGGHSEVTGPIFKMKSDPRVTRIGRLMRRISVDELPQLFNVIKGEMSLVGPRPLPIKEAEACTGTAEMRHTVQPGITGLWQVLGRSDIPFEEMVQLDYLYVTNWTIKWDFKILLRTVFAIARKRGAY